MKTARCYVRATASLFLAVALACGLASCTTEIGMVQHFPPAARQMPAAQLATIVPKATSVTIGRRFGVLCDMDGQEPQQYPFPKVQAIISSIRPLDSGTNEPTKVDVIQPFYVAPGKYEVQMFWMQTEQAPWLLPTPSGQMSKAKGFVNVLLDAKAGKTYALAGKFTDYEGSTSTSFTFTEKP